MYMTFYQWRKLVIYTEFVRIYKIIGGQQCSHLNHIKIVWKIILSYQTTNFVVRHLPDGFCVIPICLSVKLTCLIYERPKLPLHQD